MSAAHSSFDFVRDKHIASLNITVEEYRHRATGAQHIHIASDNTENVFLVALRTVPHDSTGVAHILEHTALCGSQKYPVRDPFFMMIRRSLNTFMNAFTSSDWTAYPFASQNRKDFNNLLDVYLDAVFFSNLDELDFAQEGHRIEFEEPQNADSPLVFKGVVFNEMKGAMSSVTSTLWHTLCHHLFPTTTYHYNSGGDPEAIPDLTYQQLVDFYRTHYHPSNAIFMTFGDIAAAEHQAKFEAQALHKFDRLDVEISVGDEQRLPAPIAVEETFAFTEEGSTDDHTHIVLGWLLGDATNLMETMEASLLSSVLLDNSASPLQKYLETSPLGTAPSPLCGMDDSQKSLVFVCGIEGSNPASAAQFETDVLAVFQQVVDEGIPADQIEASLHQLELQAREITGDGYPYGLQLILSALTNATHRGDPIALLDLDPVLAELRQRIQSEDYVPSLVKRLLLDNHHRVRLTLVPDPNLAAAKIEQEKARLAAIKAQLSDEEKQQIIARAEQLKARQERDDDPEILPSVGLEDIPATMAYVEAESNIEQPLKLARYSVGTNGLVYQQTLIPLPAFNADEMAVLPYYPSMLTELGVGSLDYLQTQLWQARVCGGFSAYISNRTSLNDPNQLQAFLVLSGKSLATSQAELTELMQQTLEQVRFDEHTRMAELIAQMRARRESSITGNGHQLAMNAAASSFNPASRLAYDWGGMAGIRAIKQLDQALREPSAIAQFAQRLASIHAKVLKMPRQYLLVAEQERLNDFTSILNSTFNSGGSAAAGFGYHASGEAAKLAWAANTQVNFCAKAYATVDLEHPDNPALTVLGGVLRNGYLHRTIREQGGAYGGGATHDSQAGVFRFYSYRDPRIEGTLADFDHSVEWLLNDSLHPRLVEESILGVIGGLDKPGSPAGEAKQTFHSELFGRTRALREAYRRSITEVTLDDLRRVTSQYLKPELAATAVITGQEAARSLAHLQFEQL